MSRLRSLCSLPLGSSATSLPEEAITYFTYVRIEDVLSRYINLPDHDRGRRIENQANLLEILGRLKCENDMAAQQAASSSSSSEASSDHEELNSELARHQQHLHCLQQYIRFFFIDPEQQKEAPMSPIYFEERERMLMRILAQITERKNILLQKCISPDESSSSSLPNLNGAFLQPQQEVLNMKPEETYIQPQQDGFYMQLLPDGFYMQPQADGAYLQLQQEGLNAQEAPEVEGFQLKTEVLANPTNGFEPAQLKTEVLANPTNGFEPADPCLMYLRDLDINDTNAPANEHPKPPMLNFGSVNEFMAWDPSMPEATWGSFVPTEQLPYS